MYIVQYFKLIECAAGQNFSVFNELNTLITNRHAMPLNKIYC